MLLREEAAAEGSLPVERLREHLRLASGFGSAEDAAETVALRGFLRAAIAAIEARTGKVLLRKHFVMRLDDWRDRMGQALPLAPVAEVEGIWIQDAGGQAVEMPKDGWQLLPDNDRPVIRPAGVILPHVPRLSSVVIRFTAGFGASWDDVPADLAQAVLMLAARYYEDRGMAAGSAGLGASETGGEDRFGKGLGTGKGSWSRGMLGSATTVYKPQKLVMEAEDGAFDGGRVVLAVHWLELRLPRQG